MRPNRRSMHLVTAAFISIIAVVPAIAGAQNIQFQGSADARGAATFIDSPIAPNAPAVIETLGVLVSGGSGTIASEAAFGAHVLSIPAAAFSIFQDFVPLSCESSAPPDDSDSGMTGAVSFPGFLEAQALECETSAVDGPGETGARGTAGATGANLNAGVVTAESARDSTSSVHALGQVESRGFAELLDVTLLEGGITIEAVRARATALVRAGDPMAATALPEWEILTMRILGSEVTVTGGPVAVSPDTLALIGVISITAGTTSSTIAPDGGQAEASVEALHVLLESGLEISLGTAEVLADVVTLPSAVTPTTFGRLKQMYLPNERRGAQAR